MNNFSLVTLSEIGGDKNLFLTSKSFTTFAQSLPSKFAPTPGMGKRSPSEIKVEMPEDILKDLSPLLETPLPQKINVSVGSAENDAYMTLMEHVKVFDSYGDVVEYALDMGWEIDETNGFDGIVY